MQKFTTSTEPTSGEFMSAQIQSEHFTAALYELLDEVFDNVLGQSH